MRSDMSNPSKINPGVDTWIDAPGCALYARNEADFVSGPSHIRRLSRRSFVAIGTLSALGMLAGCTPDTSHAESAASESSSEGGAASSASAPDPRDEGMSRVSGFAFDTLIDLGAYGDESVLNALLKDCVRLDDLLSAQKDTSDIARLNAAGGAWVDIDADTADLLKRSIAFCEETGGMFDITIGAVSLLWDFKEGKKPDDAAIQAALPHIDITKLEVEGTRARLTDPDARIDVGGVAKGWIADYLAQKMRDNGITSGIINLGGNVFVLGEKPSGAPWVIGLRDPNISQGRAVATIEVRDASVVTSGLYERHFELDGIDYYHILDPHTGYPAHTDVRAVSVITPGSFEGDGLSTLLFLKGWEEGVAFANERPETEALFTDLNNTTHETDGFSAYNYTVLPD